jgi:hypothetical protein
MWKLVLLTGTWYAVQYEDEDELTLDIDDAVFEHVRIGNVVALTDDLETFADQMNIIVDDIVRA